MRAFEAGLMPGFFYFKAHQASLAIRCFDQGNKTGFCKVKTWLFTGTKGEPTMKFANGVGHLEVGLSAENCRTWTAEDLVKEHVKN